MDEWLQALMKASPESYAETFDDMVHGWMSSRFDSPWLMATEMLTVNRADFNNQRAFEEYLRGYRILRSFYAKHL
jgi:hypothetical protein